MTRKSTPRIYEGPLTKVTLLDTSFLKGKRIVLDPGHGGAFPGAVGRGGLKESQVNLGVALYLWGLLRDAGAEVLLTRSSDRDFLRGENAGLRDDLSRRVEIAVAFGPDLFVSLHHNADIFRSRDRNQIETYFKMTDESPSKDVARLVHERLVENLGTSSGEVVPGNYFVLRNMPCTAILGEPSYLTNPRVEKQLRLAEKQLLEAQAYFLGILEYFRRGVPRVASLSPCDTVLIDAQPLLTAVFSPERSPIDTSSVILLLDGTPIAKNLEREGELVKARPQSPLANGRHELCVSCQNLNKNSSGRRCCQFEVSLPPSSLAIKAWPDCIPGKGGVLVTAEAKDVNGNAIRDGTSIRFFSQNGGFSAESVAALGGSATSVFFADLSADQSIVRVCSRSSRDSLFVGDSLVLRSCRAAEHLSTQALRVVADNTGEPLGNAGLRSLDRDSLLAASSPQGLMVFTPEPGEKLALTRTGFIPIPIPATAGVPRGSRPGPTAAETTSVGTEDVATVRMKAVASGALSDARIVIDVGSASRHQERALSGHRTLDASEPEREAEELSAEVGVRLERALRGAGAQLLVLNETVPDEDKVLRSEKFGAQTYVRIEPSPQRSGSVLHYPGSSTGTELARGVARWWGKMLSVREPSVGEDARYVVRQTSCPAVVVMLPTSAGRGDEKYSSIVAYALFLGILENTGLKGDRLAELTVRTANHARDERLDVVLDEFISVNTSAGEDVTFFCKEGQHLVRIHSRDGKDALQFVYVDKNAPTKLDLGWK
ncbi:MAG: N-acetylmuramoyl-L-alanine amidase [Candidatus Eisenbacteria bacterium]|nr:N-acetylmuramoyl-L-alanine amidase [Candidatus Eisenbacteria bacterium]